MHAQPVPLIAVAVSPAGNVSTTVTVPTVGPAPELVTVMVAVGDLTLREAAGMASFAASCQPGPAPAVTVNIADAPAELSASGVVTAPLLSVYTLGVLLVTLTLYVQVMPAGTTPTVSASVLPPAAAVSVPVQPAPVIAAPGVPVFTTPAGYVSVRSHAGQVDRIQVVSVIVSTDVVPVVIEFGTKLLATANGVSTERRARSAMTMPLPAVTSKPAASISIAARTSRRPRFARVINEGLCLQPEQPGDGRSESANGRRMPQGIRKVTVFAAITSGNVRPWPASFRHRSKRTIRSDGIPADVPENLSRAVGAAGAVELGSRKLEPGCVARLVSPTVYAAAAALCP